MIGGVNGRGVSPHVSGLRVALGNAFGDFMRVEGGAANSMCQFGGSLSSASALGLAKVEALGGDLDTFGRAGRGLLALTLKSGSVAMRNNAINDIIFSFEFLCG